MTSVCANPSLHNLGPAFGSQSHMERAALETIFDWLDLVKTSQTRSAKIVSTSTLYGQQPSAHHFPCSYGYMGGHSRRAAPATAGPMEPFSCRHPWRWEHQSFSSASIIVSVLLAFWVAWK
ncbi:hypothetical protein FOPG_19305 [Fusarium oxysporum f. sp. conglutinans race 2 54008]|uniref:Uncharacterized protein n=1 Tax=Fusarium oxysporum f. sp. conglutinans race 2 54008 TaxID=1089457 RepID=X0HTD6_FUSOX|nr:hypothetical protein FOPG_19305 [Fusarium oxysporum f. sp. conglutinans race 2 54008]